MINAKLMREEGVLVVSLVDKLQSADFEWLRLLADPHIEERGELKGLLIDAENFPSWEDFAGLLSHLRFVRDYQQVIERVAVVTDSPFVTLLPRVADFFVAAEVRHFRYRERDKALCWLRSAELPQA